MDEAQTTGFDSFSTLARLFHTRATGTGCRQIILQDTKPTIFVCILHCVFSPKQLYFFYITLPCEWNYKLPSVHPTWRVNTFCVYYKMRATSLGGRQNGPKPPFVMPPIVLGMGGSTHEETSSTQVPWKMMLIVTFVELVLVSIPLIVLNLQLTE